MGAVEDVVKNAADFIGPFLDKGKKDADQALIPSEQELEGDQLVEQALFHLQAINAADQTSDPKAPYDSSLVGVVYGLLDIITSLGILPFLPPGVAFSQRPRSVLLPSIPVQSVPNKDHFIKVLKTLMPISEQEGSGVHPLLVQRILPDFISATADLAFSPHRTEYHAVFKAHHEKILATTPISRLLPILTTFLQQNIPAWLRQRLSRELAMVPLRTHGVRHTIDFLSLSYLYENSQMPQDTGESHVQIPLPLEAITQASRLLSSVPSGMEANEWFTKLAPQLLALLDGNEGVELSRAASQIITGGILNRRSTGAPGSIGWELFVRSIHRAINPGTSTDMNLQQSTSDQIITDEKDLGLALRRLSALVSPLSQAGLMKRLIHPVLIPVWGLLEYAKTRPSLDKSWQELSRNILIRYISVACDPEKVDAIATNLFWEGESSWGFGPGSQGGVEIRSQNRDNSGAADMGSLFSKFSHLDAKIASFISILKEAKIDDEVAGAIFLRTTQRWLKAGQSSDASKPLLLHEEDMNPLNVLVDAKLSEAMATAFKNKFARSPQHIVELTGQLLQNYVDQHKAQSRNTADVNKPSRAALKNLVNQHSQTPQAGAGGDTESEDLVSFALSILNMIITSPGFNLKEAPLSGLFSSVIPSLQYLSQTQSTLPIPPLITNASTNLLQLLQPPSTTTQQPAEDPTTQHRLTLKSAIADLTSPEPPNRAWALSTIRNLITNPSAFPILDIPSLTHQLLSASVADAESYVFTAAIPALVDLATRAPNPTLRILIDAFIDVDERSLRLRKEQDIQEAVDFRLRVGEILNNLVLSDEFFEIGGRNVGNRFSSLKMIIDAVLAIASRRGQRTHTLSKRSTLAERERLQNAEAEEAWGGPIPNLLDPEGENAAEQRERDEMLKIVTGWEETGIEEDVRIRASALSIFSVVLEKRLEMLSQVIVDGGLQMVLQILVIERGDEKGILRRAAVLVVLGLLRGMYEGLEGGKEMAAGMGMRQTDEVERVLKWVRDEDGDELVRGHAEDVLEGLETWRMKKLFKVRDEQNMLTANFRLEDNLQGLNVNPRAQMQEDQQAQTPRKLIVEEIE